jgi:hypothetical protein
MRGSLSTLLDGQDPPIRNQMIRRVDSLMSHAKFLKESRDRHIVAVARTGWSMRRLELIFSLNAFYLCVLGPLASSAKGTSGTVWHNLPIAYGDLLRFDSERARKIRVAQQSFIAIANKIPGGVDTLSGNQASDIIFRLYRAVHGNESGGSVGE